MKKLTDQNKIDIVKEYTSNEKITCYELGRKYNIRGEGVSLLLRRRGVKIRNNPSILHRKYTLNQEYFNTIDTEAKAYFLGLLYADGCVMSKNNSIVIGLQPSDKAILESFMKELDYSGELILQNLTIKNPNRKNSYRLTLFSKTMCDDLIKLGCVPRKSLILKFPTEKQVPNHLLSHFVRGYFDGDGCFSVGSKNGSVTIVSTDDFCQAVKLIIKEKLNINCCIYKTRSSKINNTTTRTLSIPGRFQVEKFLEWIYSDSNFYLNRKYDKYKNWYSTQKH